jgi:hypothetical protein
VGSVFVWQKNRSVYARASCGANTPLLQAETDISLSRALLVPEGVPRAPSL